MPESANRIRKVAIYGRISTEHEAQLSAFENQQAWYESAARSHPEWKIVERYYDEGITGTSTQKRPAFLKMMDDAKQKKFDLIVTREVCRFSRNTIDSLLSVRELQKYNVEVYFISDNIWTMSGDGELRLTLMSTLAQEESRRISERVRAGQETSREKHVIYGNGNILGYSRVNGTYIIDPEQAVAVHKIFELYASGLGYQRVAAEMTRLGYKNAQGNPVWEVQRIGRILRNATYMGFICYHKSRSDGYLTQKRINNHEEDFVYVKGNFEPIVSEDLWHQCEAIRNSKNSIQRDATGKLRKFCKKNPQSIWSEKLRCSCGSAFRRFRWNTTAGNKHRYGFECYRRTRQLSANFLSQHGLDPTIVCQAKSIPSWQIDMMAVAVFRKVWKDRKDAVILVLQMLQECATQETESFKRAVQTLEMQLNRLQKKQAALRDMRADGEISRDEFLADNERYRNEIQTLELQIADLKTNVTGYSQKPAFDMDTIKATLDRWIDFSEATIPDALIDQFILQVVVIDDNTFNWTLDLFASDAAPRIKPSQIAWHTYWNNQRNGENPDTPIDVSLSRHIANPSTLFSFTITKQEAADYCKKIGMKFFASKWHDKTIIVSM